jgi:hypothetical protein
VTRRFGLEMDNLEAVWLQLKLQGKKILFGTFYIPPNSNQDIWLKLENTVDMALNDNSVYYIMATGTIVHIISHEQIYKRQGVFSEVCRGVY